jgi:hypothetical protein
LNGAKKVVVGRRVHGRTLQVVMEVQTPEVVVEVDLTIMQTIREVTEVLE